MVRKTPHIHFQFPVDIGAIPYIMLLFGHHLLECLPITFVQHQLLRGLQHAPAHGLTIIFVDTLLLEEADDVLIYPLLVTLRLLVQIVHHTPFLLAVVVEGAMHIHHLTGKIAQADYQMEILTVGHTLWTLQLMLFVEGAPMNPPPTHTPIQR